MNLTSGILASNDNVLTQAIKIENGKTYAGLNGTSLLESATQTTENLDLIQLLPSSTAPIVQGVCDHNKACDFRLCSNE